jgi:CheY-like chemotaxis protein
LADDEAVLRMLISDTLEDEGYELDTACDGEEAINKIKANHYDLVILDNMMPKFTGCEVIEQVRRMPDKGQLKILMLTAKSQQSERERVAQAGANAFMSKPFSPLDLARKIGDMLNG